MNNLVDKYNNSSLILRILVGLIIGVILGLFVPGLPVIPLFGSIFVSALKAIAPILVFVLVISFNQDLTAALAMSSFCICFLH